MGRALSLVLAAVLVAGAGLAFWLYLGSDQAEPVNTPAPAVDLSLTPDEARAVAAGPVQAAAGNDSFAPVDMDARLVSDGDQGPYVKTAPVSLDEATRGPLHVQVPSVRIDAPVQSQGISKGQMTLPADLGKLGLLETTAPLGSDEGSTLVAGHVSYGGTPAAMYYLGLTKPGQSVKTWDEAGVETEWVITDVRLYSKQALPAEIFQPVGVPRQLNLVTCGGKLHRTADGYWHHDSNVVVTAVPMEV